LADEKKGAKKRIFPVFYFKVKMTEVKGLEKMIDGFFLTLPYYVYH
jgi:hypothetical protein